MNAVTLFSYITQEEQERMKVCFGMREAWYENNETIMEYAHSMKKTSVHSLSLCSSSVLQIAAQLHCLCNLFCLYYVAQIHLRQPNFHSIQSNIYNLMPEYHP